MKVKRAEHWTAAARSDQCPPAEAPEVAFLGRSNVGKSSLLNKLVARKQLARTSATPGKTRLIHFYRVEIGSVPLTLVDLPGYGYAKVSQREREQWRRLIEGYLAQREALRLAVLLQDLRRDLSDDETLLLEWLAERSIPAILAITKSDKLKPMRRAKRVRELRGQLADAGLKQIPMIATSAQTAQGLDEVWKRIHAHVAEPEAAGADA